MSKLYRYRPNSSGVSKGDLGSISSEHVSEIVSSGSNNSDTNRITRDLSQISTSLSNKPGRNQAQAPSKVTQTQQTIPKDLPFSLDNGHTRTELSSVSKTALGGATEAVGEGAVLKDRSSFLKKNTASIASGGRKGKLRMLAIDKQMSEFGIELYSSGDAESSDLRAIKGSDPRMLLVSLSENGQFAAAVKAVFERSWTQSFKSYLDVQIAEKEQEIRETCRGCYVEFVEAVDSLLTLSSDAYALRKQVNKLAGDIDSSTSSLLKGAWELTRARSIRENIAVSRILLVKIQNLLAALVRAEKLVDERQHYAGLRAIRLLETNYSAILADLPQLAAPVRQRCNALMEMAFSQAESELERWFTQAGLISPQVGERVLKLHVEALLAQEARALRARRIRAARMMFVSASSKGLDDNSGGEDDDEDAFEESGYSSRTVSPSNSREKKSDTGSTTKKPVKSTSLEKQSLVGLSLGSLGGTFDAASMGLSSPIASPSSSSSKSGSSSMPGGPQAAAASVSELLVALSEGGDAIGLHDTKALSTASLTSQSPTSAVGIEGSATDADFGLATLYQCSNTFKDRGADGIFKSKFAARRLHTLAALLDLPPVDEVLPYLRVLESRLSAIIGFIVLEVRLAGSAAELSTLTELEAVWERACNRLSETLCRQALTTFRVPSHFVAFKQILSAFSSAIQSCHLPAQPIGMILRSQVFRRFEEVLEIRFVGEFANVISSDRFDQLEIADSKEYQSVVLAHGLRDPTVHVTFPAKFPFSAMVPGICKALKTLIASHHRYTSFLPFSVPADAVLELSMGKIMGQIVPQRLTGLLNAASNVAQIAQLALNASALVDSTPYLRSYLLSFRDQVFDSDVPPVKSKGSSLGSTSPVSPKGVVSDASAVIYAHVESVRNKLVNLKTICEDSLYELIRAKIDVFLELLPSLDWLPTNAATRPSEPIEDLIGFLETTLACLQHLPDAIREAVQFTMCRHIATIYMLTLHMHVKKFNQLAIANMELDIVALEEFAARCNLPNLPETFAELRQLSQLLLSGDVFDFADPQIRNMKYPYLSPMKMVRLLDKVKDLNLLTRMPRGIHTIKKKDIDLLISKLKKEHRE